MAWECPKCKRYNYRSFLICPSCGHNIEDNMQKVVSTVKPVEKVDSILYWDRKATKKQVEAGVDVGGRITYYHNLSTGNQSIDLNAVKTDRNFRLIKKKKDTILGMFVMDDTEHDLLVFCQAALDTNIPYIGEKRSWVEVRRIYVDKERNMYYAPTEWARVGTRYCEKSITPEMYIKGKYKKVKGGMDIVKYFYINEVSDDDYSDFTNTIRRYIPEEIVSLAGNKMIHVNTPATFVEYLTKSRSLKPKSGPKQQKIDEFTAVALPEVEKPEISNGTHDEVIYACSKIFKNVDTFATLEAVPGLENTCVIRTFSNVPDTDIIKEGYRMYIQKKSVYTCKTNEAGQYVYSPLYSNPNNWDFSLMNFDKEVTKGTLLEYFGSIIEEIPVNIRSKAIWAFIKWPILEQIYKAGYGNIANYVLNNSILRSPADELEDIFGKMRDGKGFLQKLGVNRFQMEYINAHPETFFSILSQYSTFLRCSVVTFIKFIFSDDFTVTSLYRHQGNKLDGTIANMDNDTFLAFANIFTKVTNTMKPNPESTNEETWRDMYNNTYKYTEMCKALNMLRSFYSMQTALSMADDVLSILYTVITAGHPVYPQYTIRQDVMRLYIDYLRMAIQLNDNHNYRPQFADANQIVDMHDSISTIINMQKDKIAYDMFVKRVGSWTKWEFNPEDENYLVVAPKNPAELAKEGTELRHCVKGYIDRVSRGITNIMFIRTKAEPNVPFFTVEVSNENEIEQIHGFSNRNLETEPDLEPFVKKWMKECKLKANRFNKIR